MTKKPGSFNDMMTIQDEITNLGTAFNGRVGVAALDLQTDEEILYQAQDTFPTASVIKLPVLITLMDQVERGTASLEEPIMLRRADKVGGSGLLQHLTPGLTMSVRDWAFMMMSISDNVATNVLIDYVGLATIQAWLQAHGYKDVCLHSKINFPALAHDQNHFGTATPHGLTRLMTAVFRGEVVSSTACQEMLRMMARVGRERVGRYLPFTPFGADVPQADKLCLVGKTGSFVGTRAQTAVIWRGEGEGQRGFVLTVMTAGHPDPETWHVDAAGVLLIGRVARVVYDYILG